MSSIKSLIILILVALAAASSMAQEHSIKGAEFLKPGQTLQFIRSKELSWSAVDSKCFQEAPKFGMWVELKTKSAQGTFVISSPARGKKKTTLTKNEILAKGKEEGHTNVKLYLGKVEQVGDVKKLVEVSCLDAAPVIDEYGIINYSIGSDNFSKNNRYFVLVGSEKPGTMFDISLKEEYEEHRPSKPEVSINDKRVAGRITDTDGKGQSGVLVTLLLANKTPVKSVKTDANGNFMFSKLPLDRTVLAQIEERDIELNIDMFLISDEGEIISKATKSSDGQYSFIPKPTDYPQLTLLTEDDWQIQVPEGKTGIVGRVVDKKTLLVGQTGVDIELYSSDKKIIKNSTTDNRGSFEFNDLEQGDYTVRMASKQEGVYTELVYLDDLDVPTKYSNSDMMDEDGSFNFKSLPSDIVTLNQMEERDSRLSLLDEALDLNSDTPIVLNKVLFEQGSEILLPSSHAQLDQLANELKNSPSIKLRITGHTDNTGSETMNKQLSEARALSVKKYLLGQGIQTERIEHLGVGSKQPVGSNATEMGRKSNRRVEIVKID